MKSLKFSNLVLVWLIASPLYAFGIAKPHPGLCGEEISAAALAQDPRAIAGDEPCEATAIKTSPLGAGFGVVGSVVVECITENHLKERLTYDFRLAPGSCQVLQIEPAARSPFLGQSDVPAGELEGDVSTDAAMQKGDSYFDTPFSIASSRAVSRDCNCPPRVCGGEGPSCWPL